MSVPSLKSRVHGIDNDAKSIIQQGIRNGQAVTLNDAFEIDKYVRNLKKNDAWKNISFFRDFASIPNLNPSGGPRITFTRASSATRVNQQGLITTAAINEPRFEYDPVTKAGKGLLIEESRTNLLLRSAEFDSVTWQSSTSALTVTANQALAPDGTVSADLVVTAAIVGSSRLRQNLTFTAASHTASAWMRAESGTQWVRFWIFDGTSETSAWFLLTTDWQRVTVTATTAAAVGGVLIAAVTSTGASTYQPNARILVWGAQLELGSFATSYIPTTSATVTRAADLASVIGNDFSAFYRQDEGSVLANINKSAANDAIFFDTNDSGSTNRIRYVITATGAAQTATPAITATTVNTVSSGNLFKISSYYSSGGGGLGICLNGGAVNASSGASISNRQQALIGTNLFNNGFINGTVSRIVYFSKRLSDPVLQSLTF